MVDLTVTTEGVAGIAVSYKAAPKLMATNLLRTLQRIGAKLQGHIQKAKLSKGSGFLNQRTGTLKRAVFYRVEVQEQSAGGSFDALARVGVDHAKARYGRVQELGGDIVPVRARNLTIPVGDALTPSGVPRFTARQLIQTPSAFGYKDTFFRKGLLFGVRPRMRANRTVGVMGLGSIVPLFVLKKRITLRPVGYLKSALSDLTPWIEGEFGTTIANTLRQEGLGGSNQ